MTFFGFSFYLAHLHIEAQLFCFYQNFISSAVQRNHGGEGIRKFSAKNDAAVQINYFFLDLFSLLHIYTSRYNFFVVIKISYLQPFREIMGGQRIRKFSAKMTPQAKKMTFLSSFS